MTAWSPRGILTNDQQDARVTAQAATPLRAFLLSQFLCPRLARSFGGLFSGLARFGLVPRLITDNPSGFFNDVGIVVISRCFGVLGGFTRRAAVLLRRPCFEIRCHGRSLRMETRVSV